MIIGYARVSTDDQNLDAQTDALTAAGAGKLFADKISGSKRKRPELDRMLDQLRDGDVVVVTKYDRLARSLKDLLEIVEAIKERDAGFRSLAEDIDTTTSAGRLAFHVFASIAQFERERISERTKEGLASARKRGRIGGRPPCPIGRPEGRGAAHEGPGSPCGPGDRPSVQGQRKNGAAGIVWAKPSAWAYFCAATWLVFTPPLALCKPMR